MNGQLFLLFILLIIAGALFIAFTDEVKNFFIWLNEFRKDHPYQFSFQMLSIVLSLIAMVMSFS